MGQKARELLQRRVANPTAEVMAVELDPHLVQRKSSGAAR